MARARAAFTMIELVAIAAIAGLLAVILVPMASRQRNAGGLALSLQNIRTIMAATHMYVADNAGGAPIRACGYSNGMVTGGWDTWNFGGKNCAIYWNGQVFDEPAYARPLNAYLYSGQLNVPVGYVNNHSPTAWTFVHGTPSAGDRTSVQIPVFRSPGDTTTRQRVWPNPTPGVSGYDDIGTSYVLNMGWWDDPSIPASLPFSSRYIEGARRTSRTLVAGDPNFVFVSDQTADVVYNWTAGTQIPGEFGLINYSAVGYADGRADYVLIRAHVANTRWYSMYP